MESQTIGVSNDYQQMFTIMGLDLVQEQCKHEIKKQLGTGKIGWESEWKSTVEEVGIGKVGIKIRIRKLE